MQAGIIEEDRFIYRILPLNETQLHNLPQETGKYHIRFFCDGRNVNPVTGILQEKGINIMNQLIFWDRPLTFAKAVKSFLQENNPGHKITYQYSL